VNDVFRRKIEQCFSEIAARIAVCFEEARVRGDLPASVDARAMADLMVDSWEGAALRCRLRRDPGPLRSMLDFHFGRGSAA